VTFNRMQRINKNVNMRSIPNEGKQQNKPEFPISTNDSNFNVLAWNLPFKPTVLQYKKQHYGQGRLCWVNATARKQINYPSFRVKIAVWTASSSSISSVYLQLKGNCQLLLPNKEICTLNGKATNFFQMIISSTTKSETKTQVKS